jgi:hypothetical protein
MITAIQKQDYGDSKTGLLRLVNHCNRLSIAVIISRFTRYEIRDVEMRSSDIGRLLL